MGYYVDTCIWLNLFKKEGDPSKGMPYWKIAAEFVKQAETYDREIYLSPVVIKELMFQLGEQFYVATDFFKQYECIRPIPAMSEDHPRAQALESAHMYRIGFLDCMHIVIAQRLGVALITRDRELLDVAKHYIDAYRPEELLY